VFHPKGPLCASCQDDYYLSSRECVKCDSSGAISPTLGFAIGVFAIAIAAASAYFFWGSQYAASSWFMFTWLKEKRARLTKIFKIVATTYQIVATVPRNLSVTMPHVFMSFTSALNVLNLGFTDIFPLACSSSYSFIDSLVINTLVPIAACFCLGLGCFLECLWTTGSNLAESTVRTTQIKDKYLAYTLFLTYLGIFKKIIYSLQFYPPPPPDHPSSPFISHNIYIK
jgi:hypothetical protein